jgi:hypothetical protein
MKEEAQIYFKREKRIAENTHKENVKKKNLEHQEGSE